MNRRLRADQNQGDPRLSTGMSKSMPWASPPGTVGRVNTVVRQPREHRLNHVHSGAPGAPRWG
eukprot:1770460-Pyramimonas_sp.AAC.1